MKNRVIKSPVSWLEDKLIEANLDFKKGECIEIEEAKEMEKKEEMKKHLLLGKVSEIIGFKKTIELWEEVIKESK